QNIELGQHLWESITGLPSAAQQQKGIEKFTQSVGEALYKLKAELATQHNVSVTAVGGSNGGRAFVDSIPALVEKHQNPINVLKLDDSRGGIAQTARTIRALGPENVEIYNTANDAPAPNGTVANREASHELKQIFPKLKVYDLKVEGGDLRINHIEALKKDSPPLIKREFTGSGYSAGQP